MHRSDRLIDDQGILESIIDKAKVCRLGLNDPDRGVPYIVPMSFGYQSRRLYFHAATKGHKLDLLRQEKRASFEIDICHGVVRRERACSWTMRFSSVIGWGETRLLEELEEKQQALQVLMNHYGSGNFYFPPEQVVKTAVIELIVKEMTGKSSEEK